MPVPRPSYEAGGYYHIYNRGRSRLPIFREPDDYLFLLQRLKGYSRSLRIVVVAYCLMPNHYHLLVRQDGDRPAGALVQYSFNSYSKAFNHRYGHCGTLFEGPYRAKVVESTGYLLHLCRYLHANPVKDGLVARPEDWPYSNYLEWVGLRGGTLVDRDFVAEFFPRPGEYREAVLDLVAMKGLPAELGYLGEW